LGYIGIYDGPPPRGRRRLAQGRAHRRPAWPRGAPPRTRRASTADRPGPRGALACKARRAAGGSGCPHILLSLSLLPLRVAVCELGLLWEFSRRGAFLRFAYGATEAPTAECSTKRAGGQGGVWGGGPCGSWWKFGLRGKLQRVGLLDRSARPPQTPCL